MPTLFEKLRRTYFYNTAQRKGWSFPSNMAHLTGANIATGNYEPEVSKIIVKHLNDGDIFLDVGANIGYFSRLASDVIGKDGCVYSFEADYENYHALTQNISCCTNINVMNCALSDNNSFAEMNHSSHSSCHSLLNTNNYLDGATFSVPTMTLDHFWKTYLDQKPINLLKIDVEGAELKVLKGMDKLLSNKMVDKLSVEFCPAIMQNAGLNISDFYVELSDKFTISIIDKKYQSVVNNGLISSNNDFQKITQELLHADDVVNINLFCKKISN